MGIAAINKAAGYSESMKPVQQFEVNPLISQNNNSDMEITQPNTIKISGSGLGSGSVNGDEQKNNGQATEKQLKNAITDANNKLKAKRTGCEFVYHEEVNRVSIKIYDKDTKKVIQEIPTEESLKSFEKILEVAGLLVDEKL